MFIFRTDRQRKYYLAFNEKEIQNVFNTNNLSNSMA